MAGHGTGQILAIGAGLCAACASVCAKLAVTSDVVLEMCQSLLHLIAADRQTMSKSANQRSSAQQNVWTDYCVPLALSLRVFCFSLVFMFNAVMWTMYVKSLQKCSSVIATVTNTASNFFFTALSGWLLFGESLSLTWWCGAAFIIAGLLLISVDHRSLVTSVKRD